MPQEIYNEGRVVGLSAWEIFMKECLSEGMDPSDIPNEAQWLTSMIGMGASMILKIPSGTTAGIHDYPLPTGSNLTASGVIIANPFLGDCAFDLTNWATKVINYSGLIENVSGSKNEHDTFSGDGMTPSFTLTNTPSQITQVTVNGASISNYTLDNNKITLIHEEVDNFTGTGSKKIFNLSVYALSISSVTIDGTIQSESTYSLDAGNTSVTFAVAPDSESDIVITYDAAPSAGTNNIVVDYVYVASPHINTKVPQDSSYSISQYSALVSNFAKIVDGIVYTKNAEWEDTISGTPKKDIDPNFNNSSTVIRLYINTTLTSDVKILFTGFNNKRLLQAVSAHSEGGVGGSTDTEHNNWINGGMLGPEIIPWATKIVFSVPTSTYNLVNSLTRTIPLGISVDTKILPPDAQPGDPKITFKQLTSKVKTNSLIDLDSINLTDYYNIHTFSELPTIQEDVTDVALGVSNSYNELVAWYPGMTASKITQATDYSKIFPPALYATQITSNGPATLVPLDTAAPGTVKGFKNSTQAYNYTQQMPDNYSIYYNPTNQSFTFVTPNQADATKWSGTAKIDYLAEPKAQVTAGNTSVKVIALSKSNGTDYSTSGTASTTTATAANRGKLNWDILLNSLKSNATYDFVGDNVRNFAIDLDNSRIGTSKAISNISTTNLTLKGQGIILSSSTSGSDKIITSSGATYKSGKNYIEFTDGTRLYISKTQPASGMRTGDIGIGW